MDGQTALYFIVAAIGFWAVLVASQMLVAWQQLMRMRFGPGAMQPVDRHAMPAEIAAILDPMAERLTALGFAYEETFLVQTVLRVGEPDPTWLDVYFHAASGSRASVQISESPEPGLAASVSLVADFDDSVIETENRRQHLLFPMPAHYRIDDAAAPSLAEHWAFHSRRVAAELALGNTVVSDRETVARRHHALRAELFEHWQQTGLMRCVDEDWRLTARGAWRFLRRVMAGTRKVAALPPIAEPDDVAVRVLADTYAWQRQEALAKHNVMSRRGKVLWFSVSALLGAAAFGAMISWEMVPAILGVLLFHEFGHALAMRAVGYRGLSVLVMPFLGAVAIGRKDDATPWQKLAVLIAGPLPGLILAVICLRLSLDDPAHRESLMTIGSLALTINLFNLLPFTPLDGGQIVDTFLFSRRPRLRFGFFVVSTGMLIGTAVMLESIALAGAALLLALAIPGSWRRMHLLRGMRSLAPDNTPVNALFERLHADPAKRPPAFAQRVQTVRTLLPWVSGRAPSLAESICAMALYLAAIALPVPLLWDTGLPQQALFSLAHRYNDVTPPDWAQQLSQAATPEARWTVLQEAGHWFDDADDETRALEYFKLALTAAEQLPESPQKTLHVLDSRLAVARFSEKDNWRQTNLELLPALRDLPTAERWRLADALETLNWLDAQTTPDERIKRYREAIEVREAGDSRDAYSLLEDRVQLARLLDTGGETASAETLLRRNLTLLSMEQYRTAVWQLEPVMWFLIAHGHAGEAETLLGAWPMPRHGGETLRSTLAWTHLVQGKTTSARAILSEALEKMEKQRWNSSQRLMLLLDLIHASGDAPEEEKHWIKEAADFKATLGAEYRAGYTLRRESANSKSWETVRALARLEAYKRLPGAEEELSNEGQRQCKGTVAG